MHGDRITLGDAELQFSIFDEPSRGPAPDDDLVPSASAETSAQLTAVRSCTSSARS